MEGLAEIVKREIGKNRKIGEYAGGSGHLSFVSISKLELREPKEVDYKGEKALEVSIAIETYTESEFEHPPEDDLYYTNKYKDKIILDKDMRVLEYMKDV